MDNQELGKKSRLSLHEAAQWLAGNSAEVDAQEARLAHAIESGALPANIKRWATEQWDGQQLAGNIHRLETFIDKGDLEIWLQRTAG